MFKKVLIGAALLSFAAFSPANAALKLFISDGTTDIIVQDQTAAGGTNTDSDNHAELGAVGYSGSVGNFIVVVSVGTSKPLVGSPIHPRMDLFNINVSSGDGGTLTVMVTDTDFILNGSYLFNTQFGGTSDGTASISSFLDNGNAEFGTGISLASFSGLAGAFSNSVTNSADVTNPFSMTLMTVVNHTEGGQVTSLDALLQVPEPATLAVFGTGLVFLGFAVRRRRKVAFAA